MAGDFIFVEGKEGREAGDVELLRDLRVLVDVDLREAEASMGGFDGGFELWREGFARLAPAGGG
jgi:hypothetical protein